MAGCGRVRTDGLRHRGHPRATLVLDRKNGFGRLWLGSMEDAHDRGWIEGNDIGAVVHCTKSHSMPCWYGDLGIEFHRVAIDDHPDESRELSSGLARAVAKIHVALSAGKNVLVHCYAGMQRAAAVTAAYMSIMCRHDPDSRGRRRRVTVEQAMRGLIGLRPVAFSGHIDRATFGDLLRDRSAFEDVRNRSIVVVRREMRVRLR